MSWLLRKAIKIILPVVIFIMTGSTSYAAVYVYEVITQNSTFQTASKLAPDAFLMYNGGDDIIYRLTVLQVYPDNKQYNQALRDYGLEGKNVRYLPHTAVSNDIPYRKYYWWR